MQGTAAATTAAVAAAGGAAAAAAGGCDWTGCDAALCRTMCATRTSTLCKSRCAWCTQWAAQWGVGAAAAQHRGRHTVLGMSLPSVSTDLRLCVCVRMWTADTRLTSP